MTQFYQFRPKPILDSRVQAYMQKRRIHNQSFALQSLIKMGLDCHDLINNNLSQVGLPIEIETMLDNLSQEQRERLLDLLVQKTKLQLLALPEHIGRDD